LPTSRRPKTRTKPQPKRSEPARKYLVTGGAGFVGSHLAEYLVARGHEVVVMDDLSTGRLENLAALEGSPRFDYVIDSVANEQLLQNICENVDAVFHLAAGVGVKRVIEAPVHTMEATLYGTEIVLHCASQAGGKKVLLTSSSEVYGKGTRVPFREGDDILFGSTQTARWCYGCSKAMDEFLALAYWRQMKLPVVIVRLFNTVGPRQLGDYGMVLPRFVQQALEGGPLEVFGDGRQTRCFAHVADVVPALAQLMNCEAAVGQVVNLGSTDEISISALAERVRDRVNPSAEIAHIPYDEAYAEGFEDLRRRVPDTTRIRELVGFQAKRTLDEIITDVAAETRAKKDRRDAL
jgi:UDP-glucose 4-epimerase